MQHVQITTVRDIWIEHNGARAHAVWAVAENRNGWYIAAAFDGRWHVVAQCDIQQAASEVLRAMARDSGTAMVECVGPLHTLLHARALHETWIVLD